MERGGLSRFDGDGRFRRDYRAEVEAKTDAQLVAHLFELERHVGRLADVVNGLYDELVVSNAVALERWAPRNAYEWAHALEEEWAGPEEWQG